MNDQDLPSGNMAHRFKQLKVPLASSDWNIQHVFFRRENADEFFVVCTGGMIGHVEVQYHFIARKDFGIDIPTSFVSLFTICPIFKGDEKGITQN